MSLVLTIQQYSTLSMPLDEDLTDITDIDDDYEEEEEIAFEPTVLISSDLLECSTANLKSCRRLFINDLEIKLDDIDEDEWTSDAELIKAKYRDDIQFECDLPRQLLRDNTYDWSTNGVFLGLNESSYSLILDKRFESNKTFLNVSCHFYLKNHDMLTSLSFPPINLGLS